MSDPTPKAKKASGKGPQHYACCVLYPALRTVLGQIVPPPRRCRQGKSPASEDVTLDRILEGLACLEGRNLGGRDLHLLPALRISALPGLLLSHVELPEARQLNLLARLERFRYDRRESLQVFLGFALG